MVIVVAKCIVYIHVSNMRYGALTFTKRMSQAKSATRLYRLHP